MEKNDAVLKVADYRDAENAREVKRLYFRAFPRAERAPWRRLMRAYREWECAIDVYFHGEKFVGFTVELERSEFVYLFFLAVQKGTRGKGYGSNILKSVAEGFRGKTIVVDIEAVYDGAPNLKDRERRRAFYLAGGFVSSGYEFLVRGVKYETLYLGDSFNLEAYQTFVAERTAQFKA